MERPPPYNPLDKGNLGASVAKALLNRAVEPLPPKERFEGAGIYAIYYAGNFSGYEKIAALRRRGRSQAPIYVGKAVPPGSRKGGFGLDAPPGNALHKRLKEHSKSVEQAATNLALADFRCRHLVVDDIWIPLGKNLLIEWFQPVWNTMIPGFGIHQPGRGRHEQRRSAWDTLHPGRP